MITEKTYNFVFITTNLINGKQYIGDHSTNKLDDTYKGSGLILRKAFKEYGKKNFERIIIEFFPTKIEAFNAQEKYIIFFETHISQNGYNISWKGGHNVKNCISEETKQKIGKSNSGKIRSIEYKQHLSLIMSNENNPMYKYQYSNEQLEKLKENNTGIKNPFFQKKHSQESIQKMKSVIKTDEHKRKIGLAHKGKILSQETKDKISASLKNKTKNENI